MIPNEPFLNVYYFWWINLSYIFFFFVSLLFTCFNSTINRYPLFFILGFFLFYEFWFLEFKAIIGSNPQLELVTTLNPQINLLLTNTLNKYHPFIFYSSLTLSCWMIIFFLNTFYKHQNFPLNLGLNQIVSCSFTVISTSLGTLMLGSWWALQEGTWGGWWNWDSSEVFGLLPFLFLIRFYHIPLQDYSAWRVYIYLVVSLSVTILFYLMLQLNFDFISHNFGSKFFFFFNSNTMSLLVLFFMGLLALRFLRYSRIFKNNLTLFKTINFPETSNYFINTYTTLFLNWLFTLWVYLSFINFLQFLPFSHLLIPSTTPISSIFFVNILIFVLLLLNLITFSTTVRVDYRVFKILPVSITTPVITPLLFKNPTPLFLLHFIILWFTYLNLLLHDITIYYWSFNSTNFLDITINLLTLKTNVVFSLDTWQVDGSESVFSPTRFNSLSWYTRNLTNTFLSNKFLLLATTSSFTNYYSLALTYNTLYLYMGIISTGTLPLIFFLGFFFFLKTHTRTSI